MFNDPRAIFAALGTPPPKYKQSGMNASIQRNKAEQKRERKRLKLQQQLDKQSKGK